MSSTNPSQLLPCKGESANLLAQQGQYNKLLEVMEKVTQQSHRAGAVIERMQAMSYQTSHQQDQVNPTQLLREIKDLAQIEAQVRHFTIDLKLPAHLPLISCDPIQIQQVILNLLRNGMQAMQTHQCAPGSAIELSAIVEQQQLWITVTDQGTGIEDSMKDSLFLAFSSNKHTGKAAGMGLGLTIGKAIIEAHGGRLNYRNLASVGTSGAEFFFNLSLDAQETI